jgi:hypothetical protein
MAILPKMAILREQDTDRIMRGLRYKVVAEGASNKIWQPDRSPGGLSISVPKECPAAFLKEQLRQLGMQIPPGVFPE